MLALLLIDCRNCCLFCLQLLQLLSIQSIFRLFSLLILDRGGFASSSVFQGYTFLRQMFLSSVLQQVFSYSQGTLVFLQFFQRLMVRVGLVYLIVISSLMKLIDCYQDLSSVSCVSILDQLSFYRFFSLTVRSLGLTGLLPQKFACTLVPYLGDITSEGCVCTLLTLASLLILSAIFQYLAMLQISIVFRNRKYRSNVYYNSFKTKMSTKMDEELSYATHKKHTMKFKIVFIGDQSVGKSSIINRFIKNEFDTAHNPTVGIDFVSKNVSIEDRSVRLQLWDTAGQERFKSLIPGYLRDSHAIFLVFDVTSRESYNNVMTWLDYVKEHRGDDVLIFIVGNKIDITEERLVSLEQAQEGLKATGGHILQVSAKTGENLQNLFKQACQQLIKASGIETSTSKAMINKQKKQIATVTGEKQRPIKHDSKDSPNFKQFEANQKQMRGSKLQNLQKKKGGKVVRQKNCC